MLVDFVLSFLFFFLWSRLDSFSQDHGPSNGFSTTRCYSSRSYGSRHADLPQSFASYSVGGWEKTEGGKRYHSKSRSPVRQTSHQWEAEQYGSRRPDLRREGNWERDRYNQWKVEYEDWYQQYYKDYESQEPSPHHRKKSRDKKERTSLVSKSHFTQKRKKRSVKRDKGLLFQNLSSSSSSGTKSSKKVMKKKIKTKAKLMNNITSLNKTPSITSTPLTDTEVTKTLALQNLPAPVQPRTSTKATSKTQSDETRKEKCSKVKARHEKTKSEQKDKSSVGDFIKKKDFSSSSSSTSIGRPLKTITVKPKEARSSKKFKRSTIKPTLGKTQSPQNHFVHGGPQCGQDIRGNTAGLLPVTHQHEPPPLQLTHPAEHQKRVGEENHSLTGRPIKRKRTEGDVSAQPQPQIRCLSVSTDESGFAPQLGTDEKGQGDPV